MEFLKCFLFSALKRFAGGASLVDMISVEDGVALSAAKGLDVESEFEMNGD